MSKHYLMELSSSDAGKLRSALHIACRLIARADYEQLRDVRDFSAEVHGNLVRVGVPLHDGVLELEDKYQAAVNAGAFKDPEPDPKPQDEWEVQLYISAYSGWRRSVASEQMRDTSRAAAYEALRRAVRRAVISPDADYRVAKVGDYEHKEGVYYLEAKQKGGHPSRLLFVSPMDTYRSAVIAAGILQKHAAPGTKVRPVFVPTGERS